MQAAGRENLAHYNYQDGKTYFVHSNRLGSTSQASDQTGALVEDQLFYPFGQDWTMRGTMMQEDRFGQLGHRDTETLLDPTPYRMFASTQGRWMIPDPLGGDITNPQSLNRYAYVLNNPINSVDPLGLFDCYSPSTGAALPCPDVTSISVGAGVAGRGRGAGGFGGSIFGGGGPRPRPDPDHDDCMRHPCRYPGDSTPWPSDTPGTGTTIGAAPDPNRTIIEAAPPPPPPAFQDDRPSCRSVFFSALFGEKPSPTREVVEQAGKAGSAVAAQQAAKHIAVRALRVPLRSSIVRSLLGLSEGLALVSEAFPVIIVGYELVKAEIPTAVANYRRECRPVF